MALHIVAESVPKNKHCMEPPEPGSFNLMQKSFCIAQIRFVD